MPEDATELRAGQVAKILRVSHSTVTRMESDPDPGLRLVPVRRLPRRGDRRYAAADVERVRMAMERDRGGIDITPRGEPAGDPSAADGPDHPRIVAPPESAG